MINYLQARCMQHGETTSRLARHFSLTQNLLSNGNDNFKLQDQDYHRFLNNVAKSRRPSVIRRMTDLQAKSTGSTISLAGGFPNEDLFPFQDALLKLKTGGKIRIDENTFVSAQQYGPTTGHPPLVEKVKEMVRRYHNPPDFENRKVAVTAGSQDAFSRSLEMMLSPGDYVVVEDPSFCGALSIIKPFGVQLLGIESDADGMKPEVLRKALSKWSPEEVRGATQGVPKVLYTNPNATNPTGMSIVTERKKEIYEIAREYNLIILEDDPYYFLQFGFPEEYSGSFLSLDVDGRVMRCDSFSKIICGGFRVGFLTGPAELVSKVVQHSEVTILHAPSLSQVVVNELLNYWSFDGLEDHITEIRTFYRRRRDLMNAAANKHLSELCEWNIPTGGMFIWLKVRDLEDTTQMALERAIEKELLVMPGSSFMADEEAPCPYIRLSFSYSSPEAMEEGCRRLAELILEEIELKKSNPGSEKRRSPEWLQR